MGHITTWDGSLSTHKYFSVKIHEVECQNSCFMRWMRKEDKALHQKRQKIMSLCVWMCGTSTRLTGKCYFHSSQIGKESQRVNGLLKAAWLEGQSRDPGSEACPTIPSGLPQGAAMLRTVHGAVTKWAPSQQCQSGTEVQLFWQVTVSVPC